MGKDFNVCLLFLFPYFPDVTRLSTGFFVSLGICQLPFTFVAPGILPCLQKLFIARTDKPHYKAFSLHVIIANTTFLYYNISFFAYYNIYFAKYRFTLIICEII